MITTDHTGAALSAAFNTRIQANFLDESRTHSNVVFFGRKVGGTWYATDVSALFLSHSPIRKALASQYGTSRGSETDFIFTNTPLAVLTTNYTVGTSLVVSGLRHKYALQVDDWIEISDYDNTEYRRVTGRSFDATGKLTNINIGEALDNSYTADECFIRFAWIQNPDADRIDENDIGVGTLKIRTGYADAAVNQFVTLFQGTISGLEVGDDGTLTVSAYDRTKTLIEYELTDSLEWDDRGLVSPPAASSTNEGDGPLGDIRYNPGKLPDNFETEAVTFTFEEELVEWNGEVYNTSGWNAIGSVTGGINPNDVMPDGQTTTDKFLPNQDTLLGEEGSRVWTIDLLDVVGFSFDIEEGDREWKHSDQVRVWTQASGTAGVVKGKNYAATPIDTTSITLNPSYIIEYTVKTLLGMSHENPETGATSDLFDATNLTDVRALAQDYRLFMRGGRFKKGTRAIEVIDNVLRLAGAYMVSTDDDHLQLVYYTSQMVPTAIPITFSCDAENASSRTWNAWDPEVDRLARNTVANRVRFRYDIEDLDKEIVQEDTNSQTHYGLRKFVIRGQDYTDYELTTVFTAKENMVRNATRRLMQRYKVPLPRFRFTAHPHALLLELGDVPAFYSRDTGMSNVRLFVTSIEKDLVGRVVRVGAELATHIVGKFAKAAEAGVSPAVGAIWDSTGFIGSVGEERLGIASDATLGLDGIGDNDGTLEPRLGKPDQWGNHVEQHYIAE